MGRTAFETAKGSKEIQEILAKSLKSPVYFIENMVGMEVYDYNKDYVNDKRQFLVYRSGRKAGKTISTAMKVVWYAYFAPYVLPDIGHHADILIVAPTQHQATIMMDWIKEIVRYSKVLSDNVIKDIAGEVHMEYIDGGGVSKIRVRATGIKGKSIRGYEPNVLIIDECAFVDRIVITSVIPSGVASKARVILTSSPFGNQGYFFDTCMRSKAGNQLAIDDGFDKKDGRWVQYYVPSTINPKVKDNPDYMEELEKLTQDEYETEIMGKFLEVGDALIGRQFLIDSYGTFKKPEVYKLYMGVDVARKGKDETVLTVIAVDPKDRVYVVYAQSMGSTSIPEVTDEVERVYDSYKKYGGIRRIFYDTTGLGAGAFDISMAAGLPVHETVFSLQYKAKMYINLVRLFEQRNIKIGENRKLMDQLSYLRREYTQKYLNPQSEEHDDYPDSLALACNAIIADEEYELLSDLDGNLISMDEIFQ